jgi:basic amino acid/polyamine antiporter, APA family
MSTVSDRPGADRVFLRKASGLIKTASNTDVLIFDVGLVSIGIGLGGLLLYGTGIYPGANLYVGVLLAGVAMILIGLGMLCWTVTIPRSGGIYVFATRSMWPPLAFMLSFGETSAWLFYSAFGAFWITTIGIAPAVTTIGIIAHSNALITAGSDLASKGWVFAIGAALEIIGAVLLATGMRRFFTAQKLIFVTAVLGTLVLLVALAVNSRHSFVTTYNQLMAPHLKVGPDAYHGTIREAAKNGWANPGFDWTQTLKASNWAFLPLIGAAFSIAIGGEIKSVTKGQGLGIIGAVVGSMITWIITFALVYRVMGYDFLSATTYSSLNGVTKAATPVTPWITLLAGIMTNSVVLTILISIGFIAWIWLWVPAQVAYGNRAIMAWSLDRVFPDRFARVSDRTHTPVPAIALATAVAIGFLALLTFTSYFATVVFIEVGVLAWTIVLVAGVFFPYRRPDLYEKSPISTIRPFGVPVMTIACALGALAGAAYFVNLLLDSFAAGHSWHSLSILLGWFAAGFVIYWIMKLYRARHGVNVDLAFKDIPVE